MRHRQKDRQTVREKDRKRDRREREKERERGEREKREKERESVCVSRCEIVEMSGGLCAGFVRRSRLARELCIPREKVSGDDIDLQNQMSVFL